MLAENSISYDSSKSDFYSSNLVIQFSKERQYGLEGTGCHIYVNPTTNIAFEVSQKNVNGFDQYAFSPSNKNKARNNQTNAENHIICRLWLYCIGIILIAIGLCLIIVGAISNNGGQTIIAARQNKTSTVITSTLRSSPTTKLTTVSAMSTVISDKNPPTPSSTRQNVLLSTIGKNNITVYYSNKLTTSPKTSITTNQRTSTTSLENIGGHWKDMLSNDKMTLSPSKATKSSQVLYTNPVGHTSTLWQFEGSGEESDTNEN